VEVSGARIVRKIVGWLGPTGGASPGQLQPSTLIPACHLFPSGIDAVFSSKSPKFRYTPLPFSLALHRAKKGNALYGNYMLSA
jgi:hypothetical protein